MGGLTKPNLYIMDTKLGTEELKRGVKLVVDLAKEVEKASKTKNKFEAISGFIDELIAIPSVAQNFGTIIAQAKDVDREEHRELVDYIRKECDLENDGVEEVIEDALEWLSLTYRMGTKVASIRT